MSESANPTIDRPPRSRLEASRLEECVVAAIETGARLRGPEPGAAQTDPVERTIAIIESEAARFRGNDFSALNAVLAGQALASIRFSLSSRWKPSRATSSPTRSCAWR